MRQYQPINLNNIKTREVSQRDHRSQIGSSAVLTNKNATVRELIASLPCFLGANQFDGIVNQIVRAYRAGRPVVAAFGGHVVKVGCSPIIIDLIERGIINAVCTNGSGAIHDAEMAMYGETSENVGDGIVDGTFGMVKETFDFFANAIDSSTEYGLGWTTGHLLAQHRKPYVSKSILAACCLKAIPCCVHVALGTDTIHMNDKIDTAKLGRASMHDFKLICDVVSDLGSEKGQNVGGVWLNIGSAVILPEVFLKAVAVARNLGFPLNHMVTANFDMLRHYRPHQNVISRPVAPGYGFEVIGHHEIMLPLLRQAIIDCL